MLPEGWKRVHLGDVADIDRQSLGTDTPGDFVFRYISLSDVSNGAIQPFLKRYSFDEAPSRARRLLQKGDVLFSSVRPHLLGHTHISNEHKDCVASTGFSVLSAKPFADNRYLFNYLFSRDIERQINALVVGSSFPAIGSSDIAGLRISLPNLETQIFIADVLSTWDAAIATTQKLLANSRNYWLALTCELLMPVPISTQRQAGSFPPSVQAGIPKLPPTPKGWRKVALGAHLHEVNRPVSLVPDTEYTLVTVRRSRGGVDKRSVLLGSEIKTPTQFFVAAGDFLISKRQIVHGACGIVPAELDGAVVSNEYAVLGGDGEIDPRFLRYLSETTYFQQTCFHSSIGVHVEKMLFRTEQWLKRPFNIPPLDEQRRIVEILDTAKQQMALAEQQLALLKAEKCALMQQLLTGKRRVRLPSTEAVSA